MELVLRVNVIYRGSIVNIQTCISGSAGPKWQTPHFCRSGIRNGTGYSYLNVRVNSINDVCILCENFVKFGPVTPELTGHICERQILRGQKTGVFHRISLDLLHRFSHSLHHMKVHYMQMMDL